MTNKTMPKQIWVSSEPIETGAGATWLGTNYSEDSPSPKLYVRADLTAGDANEPLTEGQFRWVSVGGERHVARLEEMLNDYGDLELFFCTTDGCSWPKEELDFIGPVIRPQEGK